MNLAIFTIPLLEAAALIAFLYVILIIFRKSHNAEYLALNGFIKRNAPLLSWAAFFAFILLGVTIMLVNRYAWIFNAGDAGEMTQIFYNAGHGHLFSHSLNYASNGAYRTDSHYFYGSSFSLNPWITPLVLFGWIYALMPHPPMQTIILFLIVFGCGGASVYYISQKITGDRKASSYLLVLFLFFPVLQRMVINKGAYDVYSVFFLLWTLYFLYTKRPLLFAILLFLTAGVGYATQFTCIAIALVAVAMYREKKYALIAGLIAAGNLFTPYLMKMSRYCLTDQQPSAISDIFYKLITRNYSSIGQFLQMGIIELFNVALLIALINPLLIMFFPKNKWARYLLIAAIPSFAITAIRSGNLTSHHAADAVAILFFINILFLKADCWDHIPRPLFGKLAAFQLLLFILTPLFILLHSQAPLRFHGWLGQGGSGNSAILQAEAQAEEALRFLETEIATEASLCLWVDVRHEAQFTSRPSVWRMIEAENRHQTYPRCQVYLLERSLPQYASVDPTIRTKAILDSPASQGLKLEFKNDRFEIWGDPQAPLLPYPEWVMGLEPFHNIARHGCPKGDITILPATYRLKSANG